MSARVVDTNVVLVANGLHEEVSPRCVSDCALALQGIMTSGKLVLDAGFLILNEYQNKTTPKTGSRPGDAFVKWALRNRANPKAVDLVSLEIDPERGFVSFPPDPDLENFDPPDRKFVAAAAAHPEQVEVLQAADSKWLGWKAALERHGIPVKLLCQADIERFHQNKLGA